MRLLLACGILFFLMGCSGGMNFSKAALQGDTPSSPFPVAVKVPACEVSIPQLKLVANVDSFEFQDSVGVTFGYNQNGGNFGGIGVGASVQVSQAKMSLSMEGLNPLNGGMLVGDTVTSDQTSTKIDATVDFSLFAVNPSLYFSTPLATVSLKGLTLAVKEIKKQYDSVSWIGNIIQTVGAEVLINGGSVTGIKVGDQFSVYHTRYIWRDMDHPCENGNVYEGAEHVPPARIATLTIVQVDPGSNVAFAAVNFLNGEVQPQIGDQIEALYLVGSERYLKKNVVLGSVAAQSFTLPGGGSFDFGTAVNGQLTNAVSQNGFVVMN